MSSARHPLPTDLVALVFDGRVYPNQAKPLESLGLNERARPLETAIEQWFSFATGKHTWVSVRGVAIRGLISARRRAKHSVWEVDALIDADDDRSVGLSLFGRLVSGMVKQKAERVFLRLDAESHLVATAREAGFFAYANETLYCLEGRQERLPADPRLRSRSKGDLFGIYQLYTHAAPANVRAIEGATFREWQAAQERWGTSTSDLLVEQDGIINAWVRAAAGSVGRFSALASGGDVSLDDLVKAAQSKLAGSDRVLSLVRDDNAALSLCLERNGFRPIGRHAVLAKRLTRPTEELAAEAAGEAVPV